MKILKYGAFLIGMSIAVSAYAGDIYAIVLCGGGLLQCEDHSPRFEKLTRETCVTRAEGNQRDTVAASGLQWRCLRMTVPDWQVER